MQKGGFSMVLWVAYLATACQPSSNLPGRTNGQAGGGGQVDASTRIDTARDGSGGHAAVDGGAGSDGAADGIGGAGGRAQTACGDTAATQPFNGCRSGTECGPIGPVKCCTSEPCWPGACPVPPGVLCPPSNTRLKCAGNQDCNP